MDSDVRQNYVGYWWT